MKDDDEKGSGHGKETGVAIPVNIKNGRPEPRFRVVDRRHWTMEDEDDGEGEPGEEPARQPTHVARLEKLLKEKDEQLREHAARTRQALEEYEASSIRLRRDAAREADKGRRAVLVEMLEVLDNLDRALEAAAESRNVDTLIEGVELIRSQFMDKMKGFNVTRMESLGSAFDPRLHEVVSLVPVSEPEKDGKVLGVVSEGYRCGDELLRPATVAVGKHEG
jgi:molecular chaperone GrpE